MPFRGGGHRGRALAGGKTDHPALRNGTQMRRQHDVGMSGSDGGIENRAQEGAFVGHFLTGLEVDKCDAGYPSDCGKRNPRGMLRGGYRIDLDPIRRYGDSAADVAADDVAEQIPLVALELIN